MRKAIIITSIALAAVLGALGDHLYHQPQPVQPDQRFNVRIVYLCPEEDSDLSTCEVEAVVPIR